MQSKERQKFIIRARCSIAKIKSLKDFEILFVGWRIHDQHDQNQVYDTPQNQEREKFNMYHLARRR